MRVLVVLAASAGCVSVGGSANTSTAVSDSPVRRVGGGLHIGTHAEIVEDALVGQLFYLRGFPALGMRSNVMGAWGARITSLPRGRLPGFYAMGAYGQNDDRTQPTATSLIGGLGVSYSWMHQGRRGRTWRGLSLGFVGSRTHQETVDDGRPGFFLGIELGVTAGFDILGPMFGRDRDDD